MVENRESITAKLCAFVRAWHSNYVREKVFDDYLAYDFMVHLRALLWHLLLSSQKPLKAEISLPYFPTEETDTSVQDSINDEV